MKRTPLSEREMPEYTRGEEIMNMVTHIVGGAFGIAVLVTALIKAVSVGNAWSVVGSAIYGISMIALYSVSSIYHGLKLNTGKRVMRIIDHCTIYFLIAGTYTPILLSGIRPENPVLAWSVFGIEWGLAALGVVLNAIDLKKYKVISMILYILMGWVIIFSAKTALECIGKQGFIWILLGGVAFTVGAVLYVVGKKKRYFHSVFHIFVVMGSILQAVAIIFYVI